MRTSSSVGGFQPEFPQLLAREVDDVTFVAGIGAVVGEPLEVVVVQTDDLPVLGDLDVGFDEVHASQFDALAERRHGVGGQIVAVVEVAAVGHDPHFAGVEIQTRAAQGGAFDRDGLRQGLRRAVRVGDGGAGPVLSVDFIPVFHPLRRVGHALRCAAVAEIPDDGRHAGDAAEREGDLLHTGRMVVADDDRGLRIGDGDRGREFGHRAMQPGDGRPDRVGAGRPVGVFGRFACARSRGRAVAEHPQYAADVIRTAFEREDDCGVPDRNCGRPDDGLSPVFRSGGLRAAVGAGSELPGSDRPEDQYDSVCESHDVVGLFYAVARILVKSLGVEDAFVVGDRK